MKIIIAGFWILLILSSNVSAQTSYDSAYFYKNLKEYDQSIEHANFYLNRPSVSAREKLDMYFLLGLNFAKKRQPRLSIRNYLLSIESYEDDLCNAKSHFNIAVIYKNFHLYDEAISHYNEAIRLIDNDEAKKGKYLASRSIAYKHNKQYDLAIKDVLQAEQIAFKDIENRKKLLFKAYSYHGLIKKDMQEFDLALKYFQYANDLNLNINDHINIGKTYQLSGNIEKAIFHYEKALASKQNTDQQFKTYQNLGELYQSINKIDESISYLKKGELLYPKLRYPEAEDIDLFNALARQYKAKKDDQASILYFEKTVDLLKEIESKKQELLEQYEKEKISSTEKEFYQTLEQERKTRNLQTIGIAGAVVALLITGISIHLLKRRTSKTKKFKKEVAIIRKRVGNIYNPSDNFKS